MKTCKKCGETKELSEFYKDKSVKAGIMSTCKCCHLARSKKWAEDNKDRTLYLSRKSYLKRHYGVTMEWYKDKLKEQKGVCAICSCGSSDLRGKDDMFCVDHCHTTGQPRALLCHKCNTGIGMLKDNPILVARAWTYLQKHQH